LKRPAALRDLAALVRDPRRLAVLASTVVAAVAGGVVGNWLGIPIPWFIGPIFATLILLGLGRPINNMAAIRAPMIGVVGTMLGAGFTTEIASQLTTWWVLFLGLIAGAVTSSAMSYHILRRFGKLDRPTAYFGAMPGGLIEMSTMSEVFGGDMRSAFVIHTLRVSLVVLILPQLLNWLAGYPITSGSGALAQGGHIDWLAAPWFLLCVFAGKPIAKALRLQAPELLGPLLLSALVHTLGFTDFSAPFAVLAAAQIAIGINMGGRFQGVNKALLFRLGFVVVAVVIAHLGCALAAAAAMSYLTGHQLIELLIAYAPGGVAEMSIITLAVGGNTALVALHHLLRLVTVLFFAPPAYRAIFRR
jgi:hypothetical protein